MDAYKITLASTGETMTGLDGGSLSGLGHDEAKRLARELTNTWSRELKGDSLAVVEEGRRLVTRKTYSGPQRPEAAKTAKVVSVRLEPAVIADLDELAAAAGLSRSAYVTRLVSDAARGER